ncbi:MAG: hypothetical protein SD837_10425 [Candidatus Electrothrix scaldis]|nr:MAG: hypothetical protein SD837_10425 [Candidatus Electrothrix sp. GW3-3]
MRREVEVQQNKPEKSTFVSIVAWIFIVLSGFTTFISILQNIMLHTIFPKEEMNQAVQHTEQGEQIPAVVNFIFNHFYLFFMLFLVVSAATFVSSIGLLKRKNWARIVFIVIMSLGIAWNVLGLGLQFTMFNSMPEFAGTQPSPPEFQNMMWIMKIASVIMVVVISSLFGFVIKKLSDKNIRLEFS